MTAELASGSWMFHVIQQIEAFKFAQDRNTMRGKRLHLIKQTFYRCLFASAHDNLTNLSSNELDIILKRGTECSTEFTKWKHGKEHLVTGRNRLLTLYNLTSITFTIFSLTYSNHRNQFSPAVLIDTVLSI